ncbi:CpsB/CapC family capsule biosynthesis tyrosine phosphatase [Luteimonas sp. MC1825]|uniref:tyrosine-protein phosphatase n=1 Tax=Luteimonas sp. MC1825 TaxID=2761107 RepID=UPI00160EB057|nr:CpsB/CapC family capsule biosynthesis tyrosine phosphatase [Luteimonas sp. MC1825]MBB6599034.1 capsular biosynthesis protein [Luteimonas sp. MC1825]QOC89167.1 capsular biosynthesis protein [Luteimonas sp. MC1825]
MLDLHCHLLPAIDDGAVDLAMSLEMARIAVADGITVTACTPHIYPGMYENKGPDIRAAIVSLQAELDREGIALKLVEGADVHLDQGLAAGIRDGRIPTLAGSRYLLFEPPHHVAPPRLEDTMFELMAAGYVPVVTHPERLTWVEQHYDTFVRLAGRGVFMQVTSGALTGRFGRRAQYWGERFVGEGHCHILATDAHHPTRRPPLLAEGREAAARLVGAEEAGHMVVTRPAAMIANARADTLPSLPAPAMPKPPRFWQRLLRSA